VAKEYSVKPTERQKKTVNGILAGETSLSSAMRNAGYAEKTSLNAKQNFVESRGVQEYLASLDAKSQQRFQMSVADKALEVYLSALEADKLISVRVTASPNEVSYKVVARPDHTARIAAADRIIRLHHLDKPGMPTDMERAEFVDLNSPEVIDWNNKFMRFLQQYDTKSTP
jgi:hypothetical protein